MDINLLANSYGIEKTGVGQIPPSKPINEIIFNGFFTVDRRWTVIYWNSAAEELLGVMASEILGSNLWEKFAGTIPLDFYTVYHKAFLTDIPLHFEEYWPEKGAWFDVVTYHHDDTLSVSFKSSKYLPEKARLIQQLRMLNELYQVVTEITDDCLWEWDLKNKRIFWIDGGHKRVFGYQVENALIPQSFWENCLHPDDKTRILSQLDKVLTQEPGPIWEEEYRFKKSNGEYAYVHDRAHIFYDGNKHAFRMIGATQNISRRKIAEIELLESERKLALIAKQTINAIIITDNEERITWINSAFTHITGFGSGEILGNKLVIFLQGNDTDPLTLQYLRKMIKSRQPFICQINNYSKSGQLYWLNIQGQPLMGENGNKERYFVIGTDITERILLENKLVEERQAQQREITHAILTAQENERADIGRELHDNMNQILVVIKMYLKMAIKNESSRELYLDKSFNLVTEVIDKIRRIAKNLVVPASDIIGLFGNIKILINDLSEIHPLKIDFKTEDIEQGQLDDNLQLAIFRIVQEQINNILKHLNATHATILLTIHHDEVILIISDNGEGCGDQQGKSGVGLINIKSRAELYHGRMEVVSSPGKGFKLSVILRLEDR